MSYQQFFFGGVCGLLLGIQQAAADEPQHIDFGRDIRPILSDNCFLCHGPDQARREADLRLDRREAALETAIEPGRPEASQLVERIESDDADTRMPPASSGKQLSDRQKQLLRNWIAQGAEYEEHWAFVPPVRPVPPHTDSTWPRNPIDEFVLAQLNAHDLQPAPQADRRLLARRLYLDLIGLPPSPEEMQVFLADDSPAAIDALIDRLLDSEHFGERWARWWLDAARYADSDGYEKDKPRSVWFYRDWVIDAMNQNLPYDRFIIEQIAGDLMSDAGQSQRVATGFLRNSMVNEEGGADPEQFRVEAMFDRIDAIGKAILGVTTQCAQCHTHKFDPLSHREYYQMFAALNDIHEAMISVFTPEQAAQRDAVLDRIAVLEAGVELSLPDWQTRFSQWADRARSSLIQWRTVVPDALPFEGQKFRILEDGSILSESYAPTKSTNTFSIRTTAETITAFRLDALTHPQLPRGGPGRSIFGTGAVTEFEVAIAPADEPQKSRSIKISRAMSDANAADSPLPSIYREKDASKDDRVTGGISYAIDGDPKTAWTTDVDPGRRNRPRWAIFVPQEPISERGEVILSFTLKQNHGGWNSDDNQNYLLGRYRFSVTDQPVAQQPVPAEIESILRMSAEQRSSTQQTALKQYWISTEPELAAVSAQIESAWSDYPETDSQLVVESCGAPRPSFVFTRGDFLNPAEPVSASAPKILGQFPDGNEPPRLRFARWLVARDNPTTARAIVNRIWQAYFGRGLVATPEDLGYQSGPPTHPQLLDWLAVEFMDSGWDLKHLHRLIARSATYRQDSSLTPELAELDPQNLWLARGPRLRVEAEIVRDIALAVSGLLNRQIGGPSVFPPAPDFLFEPPASYGPKVWQTATDAQQYRRSLYVHSYRSVPYPVLQVFDAPKGDAACVRRERSNTPLQALVMLNEPQFVACARGLATRILRAGRQDDRHRLEHAYWITLSRPPEALELEVMQNLLEEQRARLKSGEIDAEQMAGVSADMYRQLTGGRLHEFAAWMVVARTLLNLDETITKQ